MTEVEKSATTSEYGPILQIKVTNHPGVMTRVVSLFSRRGYNVEGIVCLPIASSKHSRMWLQIGESSHLPQIVRQLEKLEDVLSVEVSLSARMIFESLARWTQLEI